MTKRFAEHNGLNLTQVNNEILEKWMKEDIFHRSARDVLSSFSLRVLPRQTVILAFITCWVVH